MIQVVKLDRIKAATSWQSIVTDFVMVTAPKPPGSRHLISPSIAVFEIAPAKVLQGAVRLHGLASSPTPETQVAVAWAWAGADARTGSNNPIDKQSKAMRRMMSSWKHVSFSQLKSLDENCEPLGGCVFVKTYFLNRNSKATGISRQCIQLTTKPIGQQ